jgi:hypothetical protein
VVFLAHIKIALCSSDLVEINSNEKDQSSFVSLIKEGIQLANKLYPRDLRICMARYKESLKEKTKQNISSQLIQNYQTKDISCDKSDSFLVIRKCISCNIIVTMNKT